VQLRLLSVGKPRGAECIRLHDDYGARIARLGVDYASLWVRETRPGGRYDDDEVRRREGRELLSRLEGPGGVVALDRKGEAWTSERLASNLERWSPRGMTFVIGGPTGLHREVVDRAERVWSLSALTFPHELARVLVAEQLYRALTILRGFPYHR
jgi:23S rRNA (pseudouridine1915-N3)-methyltransferase